jgi:hypothetical protein
MVFHSAKYYHPQQADLRYTQYVAANPPMCNIFFSSPSGRGMASDKAAETGPIP